MCKNDCVQIYIQQVYKPHLSIITDNFLPTLTYIHQYYTRIDILFLAIFKKFESFKSMTPIA